MKRTLLLILVFMIGAFLRMILLQDIEFKYDENFMYQQARSIGVTQPWPMVGMESGVRVRNPALSIWIFVVLDHLFSAQTPPELARAVQVMNVLAVGLVLLIGLRLVPPPEQLAWLWAGALVAVNPLAVLLHRKIWAQSTLPLLCGLMWLGWLYRDRKLGAFFWGFLGACLGQIHMSGFFLAFALFLWTAVFGKKVEQVKRVSWIPWGAGSVLGSLGLVPWVQYLFQSPASRTQPLPWTELLHFRYWTNWVTDSFGLGLSYSLGHQQFEDFLRYPLIAGTATWLMGLCHLVLLILMVTALIFGAKRLRRAKLGQIFTGSGSASEFSVKAAFLGAGLLLTLTGAFIHRHYMIVTFPLEFLWLSMLLLGTPRFARWALPMIFVCNLILSVGFLHYIHVNHGAVTGDYGVAYEFQH